MKKTFSFSLMAVAFIATLILAGCQKDANILRVRIDNFGGNGKVYIGGTNSNVPTWNSGDIIWIDHCDASNPNNHSYTLNDFNNRGEALLTLPNYPSYCALYPYDLGTVAEGTTTASITIPQVQRYYVDDNNKQVVNAPMAACTLNDPNGSISFHNLGALLAITIECNILTHTSMVVDEVRVTSESGYPLWGSTTVDISDPNAIFDFRPATSAAQCTIYLRKFNSSNQQEPLFSLNTTTNKKKTVYVYVPAIPSGVNNKYTIEVVAHNGSTDLSRSYTQTSNTGGNLPRNTMANVEFLMRPLVAPTGAVPDGRFTIDVDGHQVYFAAGNLQYQASSNTWRIAEHQWDLVGGAISSSENYVGNVPGSSNNSISSSYSGWIDLFGWGTSGFDNTANDPDAFNYYPYCYTKTNYTSEVNKTGYGPSINKSLVIRGTTYENYDWGVYHSNPPTGNNTNGGIKYVNANNNNALDNAAPGDIWRILSQAEWDYLLNQRSFNGHVGLHYSYSGVTYNGVVGILIYPDGFTDQKTGPAGSGHPLHYVFQANTSLPSGCVFLPASGQRNGQVMSPGTVGFYWTSNGSDANKGQKAYPLVATANVGEGATIDLSTAYPRYYGYAVRLVTPVTN